MSGLGLTHSCLLQQKASLVVTSFKKSNIYEIFQGDLFIKTQSTTLLQIVSNLMPHSEVIFKSMTGPDNTRHEWVNLHLVMDFSLDLSITETDAHSPACQGTCVARLLSENYGEQIYSLLST